jgi:HEAT repeat protein
MRLASLLLISLVLSPDALGHGGNYMGPTDGAGGGSAAGASGGGGTSVGQTPGGSGPGAAGSIPAVSKAPTSRSSARGSSGRATATSGSGGAGQPAYLGWEFWWESNRDAYLDLKSRLLKGVHVPGSPGQLTGRGAKQRAAPTQRPSTQWVSEALLPQLVEVARSADDRDVLDSTILAMARSAPGPARTQVSETITGLLDHRELSVQAAAALGLGVLRDGDSVPLLQSLLHDDSTGRQAVGGGSVPTMVRAFSALALGLVGDAPSVRALLDVATRFPDSDRDIKCCAVAALGLVDSETSLAGTAQQVLLTLLEDPSMDDVVRSYVPTTLGKLGNGLAVAPMLEVFRDSHTPNPVRQSLAIGLGQLAGDGDPDVLEVLDDYVDRGRDQQTRHFALVSLGQIAARLDAPKGASDAQKQVVRRLLKEIDADGASRGHRSWAALGAAVLGRAQPDLAPDLLDALRSAHVDEHDPSFRGAFALSLALLGDRASSEAIAADLVGAGQDDLRGHAAEALGLLRHSDAAPTLRALCLDSGVTETLRLKAATGLGLMGDREAVPLMVDSLRDARSLSSLASQARALGLIGDEQAGASLMVMAGDDEQPSLPRAFSLVALGLLGERDRLPFNAALRADNNYYAQVPAIAEALAIL